MQRFKRLAEPGDGSVSSPRPAPRVAAVTVAPGIAPRAAASLQKREERLPACVPPGIAVYERMESVEALRADWETLLEDFACGSPFCTWEWLTSWWRAYGGDDRLLVVAVRNESSELIGLAPLAMSARRVCGVTLRSLRLVGDGTFDSDNLDLPVRPGCEAEFGRALLDWLARHARDWDICQLRTLPADSPMGNRLPGDLKARGWKTYTSRQPHPVVELRGSWDAYLKALSSKERGKIGSRARRLEKRYQVRVRKCAEASELDSALEALFDLHSRHWRLRGLEGSFRWPARRQFYRALAPLLLAREQLEFWLLELDGVVVAAQFALRHGDTAYSLQEGFDPEYASDSVGYVLRSHVLKDLIGRGVRQYDFLFGVDESKLRWGARVHSYVSVEFARPGGIGGRVLPLMQIGPSVKAWMQANLPDPVLRALKRPQGRGRDDE
ncbi:MAG TPA: GNAT family N-acetyltransferase [Burkholderiales bacterium]|jgi:CelD/BcsL family acetyltransferase involved in cellulose biosynthesis